MKQKGMLIESHKNNSNTLKFSKADKQISMLRDQATLVSPIDVPRNALHHHDVKHGVIVWMWHTINTQFSFPIRAVQAAVWWLWTLFSTESSVNRIVA